MPDSTPAEAYEGLCASCPQLQVLHLKSCYCSWNRVVVLDAPRSEIREIVVDKCRFRVLKLMALPCLESLASLDTRVLFESSSFPCLRQWNLTYSFILTGKWYPFYAKDLRLELFLGHTPDIIDLIVRFTGPERWIVPSCSPSLLPNLRRLLVADVPSSWDVSWPRLLLETVRSLESLHIHIAPCVENPGDGISWQPAMLGQHQLKEFVMAGFEGTERQIYFVKFVVGACTALRHVALFKHGHVQDKGHWDWEMVRQQHTWTDEEKDTILKQITDGVSCSTALVQVVLG